jgi:hypothetical protein
MIGPIRRDPARPSIDFRRSTLRRFPLLLAALALAATASAPSARAAYIDFTGSPSTTTPVTITSSGISGSGIPLSGITGEGTPSAGPAGYSNLTLSFSTGAFQSNLSATDAAYGSTGSTVTITGVDSGGHTVTLFNGAFSGTTQLVTSVDSKGNTLYQMIAGGIIGVVNQGLDNAFGLSYSGLSDSAGAFMLTLGSALTPTSADITVDPQPLGPPAAAPEPASLALMALGLPIAYVARRRAAKNRG